MSQNRAEYERATAASRGHTVSEMRGMGYYSAKESAAPDAAWQTFAIPPAANRREAAAILRPFSEPDDLEPKPYGSGGP